MRENMCNANLVVFQIITHIDFEKSIHFGNIPIEISHSTFFVRKVTEINASPHDIFWLKFSFLCKNKRVV